MATTRPPDLPADPNLSATLGEFLRRLATWAFEGIRSKLSRDSAEPAILMSSPAGKAYRITIDDNGRLVSTPLVLGTGKDTTPVVTFAPVTANGMVSAANPAGTTSATFVMMGLALPLTTSVATKAFAIVSGIIANSVNNGVSEVALFVGTGAAPANGAAVPGGAVQVGQSVSFKSSAGSGALAPFALTGLGSVTPGTTYWLDLGLRASAGTASVSNVDLCWQGLP